MSATYETVLHDVETLDREEQYHLYAWLRQRFRAANDKTVEDEIEAAAVEAAWDAELAKRIDDVKFGRVELISAEQVEREMDALFVRRSFHRKPGQVMNEVEFKPEARIELLELTDYFLDTDPDLAAVFAGRLQFPLNVITATPLLFHPKRYQVRRVNLGPRMEEYYIAYRLFGERIIILAVGHARRRPYYFRAGLKTVKDLP